MTRTERIRREAHRLARASACDPDPFEGHLTALNRAARRLAEHVGGVVDFKIHIAGHPSDGDIVFRSASVEFRLTQMEFLSGDFARLDAALAVGVAP